MVGHWRFSGFVNHLKSEAAREQTVLFADGAFTSEAETLAQPEHGFEAFDGPASRMKGLEAADLRHVLLDAEMLALNALLQMFRDRMDRVLR